MMLFAGAKANMIDNTIQGTGVAGIRVAGSLVAVGNRFDGVQPRPTGPPHFAVWGLPNSQLVVTNNQMHNWRHGIYATRSTVTQSNNQIRETSGEPIVVVGTPAKDSADNQTAPR